MAYFKEIVTKAVIGKAKKQSHNEYTMIPEEKPNTILGCWVINHSFSGKNDNGKVLIEGSFDVNIWYSYDNDTKTTVSTQEFKYSDLMQLNLKDSAMLSDEEEIIVRSLMQPNVTDVKILNDSISMKIEKELGVEIVGDTKLKISVEDDEDEYEIISDVDELDDVNENFLS